MVILSEEIVASSSSSSSRRKYGVFLSFRGEDTRRNFTDHLYSALKQRGINTFRDDERLERGKPISPELLKAIEESSFAVVVFSRNYAASTWCLDELAKIVECMKEMELIVLPVFYDVDPSDVRKQTGTFAEAFAVHEKRFKENMEKVQTWRSALTDVANLSGWHLGNRYESEVIRQIVKEIFPNLHYMFPNVPKGLVGIGSQVEEMNLLLCLESNDVRVIGIWGMGGIGKTTLAKVVCSCFSDHFERRCYFIDVKDVYEKRGSTTLQQLLSDIFNEENVFILNVDSGVDTIKNTLGGKKILLILDDVNHQDQLKNLDAYRDWFGFGSRIIITTRDKHLLNVHGVDEIHKCKGLNDDAALKLFCLKAFKKEQPKEGYGELSKDIVYYAGGLPLALDILGSFLVDRGINEWTDALKRLKEYPNQEIFKKLEISYDGLEQETEKRIFIYIACFLEGRNRDQVIDILESFDLHPVIGMGVLVERSLITISNKNIVRVHDLLQRMAWEILRKESPTKLGKRKGLKLCKDVFDVLKNNKGTEEIEIINQEYMEEVANCTCDPEAFSNIRKLGFLKINNVHFPKGLKFLSNELRILEWFGCPLKSLPSSFQPNEIREINLHSCQIKILWKGAKEFPNLESINVCDSKNLTKIPNLTRAPRLKKLNLHGCTNLVEGLESILVHKKLNYLNLAGCTRLKSLSSKIDMESLKILILSNCSKVKKIPEFGENMKSLQELYLNGTAINKLPSSIEHLTGLALLNVRDCRNLVCLPSNIWGWKCLKEVNVSKCSKLEELPKDLGEIECLEKLDVSETAIKEIPSSISLLTNYMKKLILHVCPHLFPRKRLVPMNLLQPLRSLEKLDLRNCMLMEGAIPDNIGCISPLVDLLLGGNNFVTLPTSISQLSKLTGLDVSCCKWLQSLPNLPSNIQCVWAHYCTSLKTLPDISQLFHSYPPVFSCLNCPNLVEYEIGSSVAVTMLKRHLQGPTHTPKHPFCIVVPGSEIMPQWFNHQDMGDLVSIELPPNWCDSKWMGFALCALFVVHDQAPDQLVLYKNNFHRHSFTHELHPSFNFEGTSICQYRSPFQKVSGEVELDNHEIWYVPRDEKLFVSLADYWNRFSRIVISFHAFGPGLEVKKCGARLIYEQDVEELKGATTQGSKRSIAPFEGSNVVYHEGPSGEGSSNGGS